MGKSTSTYRELLCRIESDWKDFRRPLMKKEKKAFDELFRKAHSHAFAAQNQARPDGIFLHVCLAGTADGDSQVEETDRRTGQLSDWN